MGQGSIEMSAFQVNSVCAVYRNCQKVSSWNALSENSSTWKVFQLTKRWNEIRSLSFMNPNIYTWCSFERRHSQACFYFLWLCRVWKLMLFNNTLMYLIGLKRANIKKKKRHWEKQKKMVWNRMGTSVLKWEIDNFLEDQPKVTLTARGV